MTGQKQPNLYIIGGAPRAGKTTLARRLARQLDLFHMSTDSTVAALEKADPSKNIRHLGEDDEGVCDRVWPYVEAQVNWHRLHKMPLVMDGFHLKPQNVKGLLADGSGKAVFLGYPHLSAEDVIASVRATEKDGDWTPWYTDAELRPIFERFIAMSNRFEAWCEEAGIPFIDTGASGAALAGERALSLLLDENGAQ